MPMKEKHKGRKIVWIVIVPTCIIVSLLIIGAVINEIIIVTGTTSPAEREVSPNWLFLFLSNWLLVLAICITTYYIEKVLA